MFSSGRKYMYELIPELAGYEFPMRLVVESKFLNEVLGTKEFTLVQKNFFGEVVFALYAGSEFVCVMQQDAAYKLIKGEIR